MRGVNWGRAAIIGLPYLWLLMFFVAPFLIVLKISFSEPAIAQPPYTPTWDSWAGVQAYFSNFNVGNYLFLIEDPLYVGAYLSSLRIAATATLITLLVGYPIAYAMARAPQGWRPALLMLVILPFWTSFLIRVYAWIGILKRDGLLNLALESMGLISQPLVIHNTEIAVYIGIVYSYLPFMILPLYSALEKQDLSLLEAAADLGCKPWEAFARITLPLSLAGVAAGCFLVFIPAMGEFVIPELLGGARTQMIGRTLWNEFFLNRDWPLASAVAVVLLIVLVLPIMIFQRMANRAGAG
ncbi:ABC transporter permease subunit [Rubrimonas cliftonensis]|uniref:Putrescine transport system permease protein n=1 Tax=Rubrimonas cliftonensis TaxID=89524 RepID=A0A1H3VWW7_9RHOB|nr:ABC transporter permease subunit [Rubrimonas cliftonensis]SDZ79296.1 putrescine transport system permease protein [Rubrimonas cliftonensis]